MIGRRVQQARLQTKPPVGQEDLAGRLPGQGILLDLSTISRIEGQSRYVMDYEAAAIARTLRVPLTFLFGQNL